MKKIIISIMLFLSIFLMSDRNTDDNSPYNPYVSVDNYRYKIEGGEFQQYLIEILFYYDYDKDDIHTMPIYIVMLNTMFDDLVLKRAQYEINKSIYNDKKVITTISIIETTESKRIIYKREE